MEELERETPVDEFKREVIRSFFNLLRSDKVTRDMMRNALDEWDASGTVEKGL